MSGTARCLFVAKHTELMVLSSVWADSENFSCSAVGQGQTFQIKTVFILLNELYCSGKADFCLGCCRSFPSGDSWAVFSPQLFEQSQVGCGDPAEVFPSSHDPKILSLHDLLNLSACLGGTSWFRELQCFDFRQPQQEWSFQLRWAQFSCSHMGLCREIWTELEQLRVDDSVSYRDRRMRGKSLIFFFPFLPSSPSVCDF